MHCKEIHQYSVVSGYDRCCMPSGFETGAVVSVGGNSRYAGVRDRWTLVSLYTIKVEDIIRHPFLSRFSHNTGKKSDLLEHGWQHVDSGVLCVDTVPCILGSYIGTVGPQYQRICVAAFCADTESVFFDYTLLMLIEVEEGVARFRLLADYCSV
jgi:hypothetical protein